MISPIALVAYLEKRRIFWPPYWESRKLAPYFFAVAPFLARCILWEKRRCAPLLTLYTQSKMLPDHPPWAMEEDPDRAFHYMRHLLAVPVVFWKTTKKRNPRCEFCSNPNLSSSFCLGYPLLAKTYFYWFNTEGKSHTSFGGFRMGRVKDCGASRASPVVPLDAVSRRDSDGPSCRSFGRLCCRFHLHIHPASLEWDSRWCVVAYCSFTENRMLLLTWQELCCICDFCCDEFLFCRQKMMATETI